jgi:substrate import-associated zinc metallohydrolase lipoprotein
MVKKFIYSVCAVCIVLGFAACSKDELGDTVISEKITQENQFDKWLNANYVAPYNIAFKYKYEEIESDYDYYTIPADFNQSVKMAHLVKYLCIEAYDEVAGTVFTRSYFPKMFFLIGEWEYRNNGTFILGTAEGGKKILLTGINDIDKHIHSAEELNHYYIKTIHHEFVHIVNQTRPYSTEFKQITGSGYVADSWSEEPYVSTYLTRGFITAYAQHSDTEDFAEMASEYMVEPDSVWQKWMDEAGEEGRALINQKLDIVKDYYQNTWNVDLDKMRRAIWRRQDDVMSGKIDLSDITVE